MMMPIILDDRWPILSRRGGPPILSREMEGPFDYATAAEARILVLTAKAFFVERKTDRKEQEDHPS
jgi:hypothetical protein